jgi:ligand-binding sensor protein
MFSKKKSQLVLRDLIDIKTWQKMQDNFSAITDITLRTLDAKGDAVTSTSKESRLCRELLKDSKARQRLCGDCLPTFLGGKGTVDKNLSFTCEAGLCNFIVPLKVEERNFGYFILGPLILVMRKSREEYRQMAEQFNIELEDLWSAILEIKVVSFQGVQSLVELVRDVGEYIIKESYRNVIREKEVAVAIDSSKLNRLLDALLDVAFQITQADMGSIMFLDKKKDELTIRSSKGIPEEIVSNTRVRLGEGISGIAAKEMTPFLINENLMDNRIRPYLKRPYISSSMVLPLKINNRVLGVMNLAALKTSAIRFSNDSLKLMHKLIDLATVALQE